ncbi:antibiotic biosynthesis monooxygenase [Acetobacter okinawensis]|uniref:antibiotic biosynthesis monooxygenase family protein n=1 Tax=Acetobacter okinawensis TaxID=1076594 RepID=UPI001BACED62|nr:antibiotic biosynthesis monooxygenase [Acetobacter okinawensis]MBS0964547.1 antibiotic biosynthesis monooxygenase [Acetobacter okinawensis]MBS0987780.1 antibiotic biosynthesis monooxygenase [Acetobacter okinawensis]
MSQYIAMNRFLVAPENEGAFQKRWLDREVLLKTVPGFVSFQFLQGPEKEEGRLYASHTVWDSYDAFVGWTQSEQFRQAHAGAGQGRALTAGSPVFEGFTVLQAVTA